MTLDALKEDVFDLLVDMAKKKQLEAAKKRRAVELEEDRQRLKEMLPKERDRRVM
jgi:hypothetical protein